MVLSKVMNRAFLPEFAHRCQEWWCNGFETYRGRNGGVFDGTFPKSLLVPARTQKGLHLPCCDTDNNDNMSHQREQQASSRRLLKDLQEIQMHPLPTVAAAPEPDNLYRWHANIIANDGPLRAVPIHLVLEFTHKYPLEPPKVKLPSQIRLEHPNVFYGWDGRDNSPYICLDMLQGGNGSHGAWSSAYSVHSVLMQLQSFLLGENIEQDYGGTASNQMFNSQSALQSCRQSALAYKCDTCTHCGSAPAPNVQTNSLSEGGVGATIRFMHGDIAEVVAEERNCWRLAGGRVAKKATEGTKWTWLLTTSTLSTSSVAHLQECVPELLVAIASQLDTRPLLNLTRSCRSLANLCLSNHVFLRRGVQCFHTKLTFEEDLMGIGLCVTRRSDGRVDSISSPVDLISKTAWEEGVKRSVCRETLSS